MTNSKDVRPQLGQITAMPSLESLSKISEMMTAQTSGLQNAIQSVVDQQNRLFANTALTSSLEEFVQSVQKSLAPTQELISSFLSATNNLQMNIASFQNISSSITLSLKAITSVSEISEGITKNIPKIDDIQSGSSCLVSMSAEVEERYDDKGITYTNSADIKLVAEVSDIKEGQKLILAKISTLEEKAEKYSIPATITDIGFVNNSHSMLEVNGKTIQFRGGIASIILHALFGRKNFSKTRTYEAEDFCSRYDKTLDWFDMNKVERKKFQGKVYQSVRNINNRFMEATNFGEKLIIQDGNNSYTLNPRLFK